MRMDIKGTLIPIGGNEDKGIEELEIYTLEFIQEGILSRVVAEAGGNDATIVVIPTASQIPVEVSKNYLKAFGTLGCDNVHIMDIRDREDSIKPENLELMRRADCVMFSGGNQSLITRKIGDTELHDIIMDKYQNTNFVVAGTSAGAMCMSKEMITGGSAKESFVKGAVGLGQGMSFIPSLIIDSHFIRRGRFGRLAESVSTFPNLLGVGLAEDTGLVIKKGKTIEVIGSGMVIIFDPRKMSHNNLSLIGSGDNLSIANMRTHVLSNGDIFNIKKRKLKILPADIHVVSAQD
ncbi:cyanophycinase [Nonlabens sp. Hel1_33_55]|uniref:cyanophycinase n=1 Tax=Nonlabens sp. Hel1_33_55 TaxID=1336802 RepID=UPI000875EBA3|nr:cyanophycinase [Nonlabens sp. Hel1_33_55]SCY23349.1 cyanophycinase [Nonlabens sp. Hel1_33_55]